MTPSKTPFYKTNKFFLISVCIAIALTGIYSWTSREKSIVDFDKSPEQVTFLQRLFKENWYRLVSEESDFELDYMLTHGISHKNMDMPPHTMKLYKNNQGKLVAFTTYYHPYLHQIGHALLLFLVVDKDERGKGYAQKLLCYALADLKKQGCTSVELAVRNENHEAQKLYKKFGFHQYWTDGVFIRMRRLLI